MRDSSPNAVNTFICLVHPVVAAGSSTRAALRCMMSLRLVGSSSARIEKELMFGPELRIGTGLKYSNLFGYHIISPKTDTKE